MLEALYIQNFQSHERTVVEFDERVTVLVGPSDQGKSALVRALKWVCLNVPQGTSFIRTGTKGTTVRAVIDGRSVKRRRGGADNSYTLDGKPPFKAIGKDVPDPIADFLNVSEVNFQNQLDAPYWFCETAGEVSRQLNSIVDLSIIDRSLKNITKQVRTNQQTIKITQERLREAQEEVDGLDWVTKADRDYIVVEAWLGDVTECRAKTSELEKLIDSIIAHKESMNKAEKRVSDAEGLLSLGDQVLESKTHYKDLFELTEQIFKQEVKKNKKLPPQDVFDELDEILSKIKNEQTYISSLSKLIKSVESADAKVILCDEDVMVAEEDLKELSGEPCPVCGKPL